MNAKNETPIDELPDSSLEKVGGGKKDTSVNCCPYCGSTQYSVYPTPVGTAIYTCAANSDHKWSC